MTKLLKLDNVPIESARKSLTFIVEPEDVSKAARHTSDSCAAAIACRERLKVIDVRVHMSRVYIRFSKGKWLRYLVSPKLREQIISFDREGKFAPGTYTLYPPPPSQAGSFAHLGLRRKRKKPYAFTQGVRELAGGLES